jgi:hypothetical protein
MKRMLLIALILLPTIIVGCTSQYDNEEVVAKVGDKEITYAEVKLIYNLEEQELFEAVESYVKEELMVQEAKEMGIDVSKEIEEQKALQTPFPLEQTEQQAAYGKKKAKELGMSEKEFYRKYFNVSTERSAYITKFIDRKIGNLNKEDDAELYMEKVNEFVNSMLTKHADEYEIYIE